VKAVLIVAAEAVELTAFIALVMIVFIFVAVLLCVKVAVVVVLVDFWQLCVEEFEIVWLSL